jgi:hypothetical protein
MSGFTDTIEKLKSELEGHIASLKATEAWLQAEKIYRALGTIEELAGAPKTSLAELFGFTDAGSVATVVQGEFMGMDALEATKLYMEKKKAVASSIEEIFEALRVGGAEQISGDSLRTKLARSTWDVVKAPGQDLYTLAKHLPHVKRGKRKPGQAEEPETTADSSDAGKGEQT